MLKKIFLSFFVLLFFVQGSWADLFYDARAMALSNALAALAQDVCALYVNPAALVQTRQLGVSGSYGFVQSNTPAVLDDLSLGAAVPLAPGWGNVGLAWRQFTQSGTLREQLFSAGMAKTFAQKLSLGAALHYSNRNLETSLPYFAAPKANYSFALGALYRWNAQWKIALSYQGLNDPAPSAILGESGILRSAVAYCYHDWATTLAIHVVPSALSAGRDLQYIGAVEKWNLASDYFKSDWALRAAFLSDSNERQNVSAGLAFRLKNLELNYGIAFPFKALKESQADHKISLSVYFGAARKQVQVSINRPQQGLKKIIETQQKDVALPAHQTLSSSQELTQRIKKNLRQIEFYQKQLGQGQQRLDQLQFTLDHLGVKNLQDSYDTLLEQYWAIKDEDGLLKVRQNYLKILLDFFKDKKISVKKAQVEFDQVDAQWKRQSADFSVDWVQYKQFLIQAPDVAAKIEKLEDMINKYGSGGVDFSLIKDELNGLK